jgi:type II secretory pathway component PulJ
MKQIALLMALLVTALPALAHEEQARRFYELERRIEMLEQRIDDLERLERRIDQLERKPQQAAPRQAAKPPPAEHKELFDCQAEAIDSTEMKACAKYITD